MTTQSGVKIMMSDGVRLDAMVAYPTDLKTGVRVDGTFPVILQQSPYTPAVDNYFVERGYIFANVSVRGTESSEGNIDAWGPIEGRDGVETVDWARTLQGSNGNIGLIGCSYVGGTVLNTATRLGPDSGVKAIVAESTPADLYREYMTAGIPGVSIPGSVAVEGSTMGATPGPLKFFAENYADVLSGGPEAYKGDQFWTYRNFVSKANNIVDNNIATLYYSSWYDMSRTGLELYTALQNANLSHDIYQAMNSGETVSGRFQVILGDGG
ncbi:MAG TPA: CocE/NonD family hydrolase, partial [Acidimicrobiales bacterium]|nr:CocE/NonD family hydrolase [Acidimicrobiales bacterium]